MGLSSNTYILENNHPYDASDERGSEAGAALI